MSVGFRHPSRKRLLNWLVRPESEELTTHVESCERCAARLEELAETLEPDLVPATLGGAIAAAYDPPLDQTARVLQRIRDRERADRELDMFLGLFAVVSDAAELMFPPRRDEQHRPDGGPDEPDEEETDR